MPIQQLLADLLGDIRQPAILWQALAIVLCVAAGWGLARLMHRSLLASHQDQHQGLIGLGVASFSRVLSPLLVVGLLVTTRAVMANYQSVHLLDIAVPLASSFAVIRTVFYLLRRVFARRGPLGEALQTFEKIFALVGWVGVAKSV